MINVLIACEESQTICKAFREQGCIAYSNDILDCSGDCPEWHIKGCALDALKLKKWDLVIAHPPCTYLSNAAAVRLYSGGKLNEERYKKGLEAKDFFLKLLNCDAPHVCVENPISSLIFNLPKHTQQIQPYEYGHPFKKKTRLWLKNLPNLTPTNIVEPEYLFVSRRGERAKNGSVSTQKDRSTTFKGIADAMASQWINYIYNLYS